MQTTTPEFANAWNADAMETTARVTMEFGNNRYNDNQVCTASSTKDAYFGIHSRKAPAEFRAQAERRWGPVDRTVDFDIVTNKYEDGAYFGLQDPIVNFWSADTAFNNKNRNSMRYGVCNRGAKAAGPNSDYAPYRAIPSTKTDYELGWWSAHKSNTSGVFASSEWIMSRFDERRITEVCLFGTEGYPNNKRITVQYFDSIINDWVTLADHYLLAADEYQKQWVLVEPRPITGLRCYVHETYAPKDFARISELQGFYIADVSDDIVSCSVDLTRESYDTTIPVGYISAGTFNVDLR